jgi:hypothetical protein
MMTPVRLQPFTVQLESIVGTLGHFWPIVPATGDCEHGEFGGMKIHRET